MTHDSFFECMLQLSITQIFQGCPAGPNCAPKKLCFSSFPSTISSLCCSISSTSQFALTNPPRKKSAFACCKYKVSPAVSSCLSLAKGVKFSTTAPRPSSEGATIPGWTEKTRRVGCSRNLSVQSNLCGRRRVEGMGSSTQIDILRQPDSRDLCATITRQPGNEHTGT